MVEGIEATFRRADGTYLKVFVPHAVGSPRALAGPVLGPETGRFEVLERTELEPADDKLSPSEDFEITEVE